MKTHPTIVNVITPEISFIDDYWYFTVYLRLSESFTVVVPGDPIVAHVGSTVILPCWISPPESAEALEIRWYRQDFNNPVLLYNHGKIQDIQECFRNRTSWLYGQISLVDWRMEMSLYDWRNSRFRMKVHFAVMWVEKAHMTVKMWFSKSWVS